MSIKIIQEQRAKNVREQKRQQRYVTCKKIIIKQISGMIFKFFIGSTGNVDLKFSKETLHFTHFSSLMFIALQFLPLEMELCYQDMLT